MNYFLSICIPTYNGGETLKYNVNKLVKMQPEYGFEICVSDNASDDGTQEFMRCVESKYKFIKYHRNKENFGFAYNLDFVINMAGGKYMWMLGDDDELNEENIRIVIRALQNKNVDICVVNGCTPKHITRVENLSTQIFYDKNEVLEKLGEHMAWISCLILSKNTVNEITIKNRWYNSLPHIIEIFKYLDNRCKLLWLNNICVTSQEKAYIRYNKNILDYLIRDWYKVTNFLKNYNENSKKVFLKNIIKRMFSNKSIIILRKENIINKASLIKIKNELAYYPICFRLKLYIISIIPSWLLEIFYNFYKRILKR